MTKPAPLKPPLDYKSAGVDIDAGAQLVNEIKPIVAKTRTAGVMAGLGGFGAGFDIKAAGFKDPILIGATDGVGTKLLIARETARFDTIGIDLVAMCVNDVLCQGAKPLFFLDYFATGKLDVAGRTGYYQRHSQGVRNRGMRPYRRGNRGNAGFISGGGF